MFLRRVTVATAIARVHGREHEVTGDRRLERDVRGLGIPHLTEHDHVRVLPQQGTEHDAERQADLLLHSNLIDPGQLVSIGSSIVVMFRSTERRLLSIP